MTTTCQHCGTMFTTFPSRVSRGEGKYCSRPCKHEASKGQPSYERTPEHRAAMRARFIGRPAIPHAVEAAATAKRGKPVSKRTTDALAAKWTGSGNPHWKDGRAASRYASGYGPRVRRAVIARDKVCVDCGLWDENPRAMHIHHLDGGKADHSITNLVLLCIACHKRRHARYRQS